MRRDIRNERCDVIHKLADDFDIDQAVDFVAFLIRSKRTDFTLCEIDAVIAQKPPLHCQAPLACRGKIVPFPCKC